MASWLRIVGFIKADQRVSAAPDTITDRVMRLARHYRTALLAAAAALVVITIVTSCAAVLVTQALFATAIEREARERAVIAREAAEAERKVAVAARALAEKERESTERAIEVAEELITMYEAQRKSEQVENCKHKLDEIKAEIERLRNGVTGVPEWGVDGITNGACRATTAKPDPWGS